MLARLRKSEENEGGFTLIELLVVVIIIGILAAIAIPTFLNQRKNGWQAQVQSDVRNAVTNAEAHAVGAGGVYTGLAVGTTDGTTAGIQNGISAANSTLTLGVVSPSDFCIQGVSKKDTSIIVSYQKGTDTYAKTACPAA